MLGNPLEIGSLAGGKPLFLPASARERHMYVCGGTGVGKSKFLESCIRQDIVNWRDSRCGLVLLDPHGLVYENVMAWLARSGLKRPVIPIDLRRDDWIVSYNLLHKRQSDSSVVVSNFVDALSHVWGDDGTDKTPLFARWAAVILLTLYENGQTIADAMRLLSRPDLRQAMTVRMTDATARQAWTFAERNPKEFENQITSTVNRFRRLTGTRIMEATFGQADVSLDLLSAIKEGSIILVNLSTKGGQIGRENANTFATLFLTDLWTAANARGKKESETLKPTYIYIDECQNFITPTIADDLDQARGYGLHLILANQFPKRLINAGKHGQAMYDSIIANAGNKIVFRLEHPDDAELLAKWLFMGTFNTDEVKLSLNSTKVLGYREEMRRHRARGASITTTAGTTRGGGKSLGTATGEGANGSENFRDDELIGSAEGWNNLVATAAGESETWGETESTGKTTTEVITDSSILLPLLGQELSSVQYRSVDEQVFRAVQKLFGQQDRHFITRFHGGPKAPLFVKTPTVPPALTKSERVDAYRLALLRSLPFALPMPEAVKRLAGREEQLVKEILAKVENDEPTTARRRIR